MIVSWEKEVGDELTEGDILAQVRWCVCVRERERWRVQYMQYST